MESVAEPIFTAPSAWLSGFYTLAIDLADRSDEHSRAAMKALLSYPRFTGWYLQTTLTNLMV
jgi:hypothetical protein